MQNEYLEVMTLHIVRRICGDVGLNGFCTIMVDECIDVSNKEQFTICLRWMDEVLVDHEGALVLYIIINCLCVKGLHE